MVKRVKVIMLKSYFGQSKEEYVPLLDYAEELKLRNPNSIVDVKNFIDDDDHISRFYRYYSCFASYENGWLEGYRSIKGLDGYFLKRIYKRVIILCSKKGWEQSNVPNYLGCCTI